MTIGAADEKRRRGADQALPADLVEMLYPRLAGKSADTLLWPGKWAERKQANRAG